MLKLGGYSQMAKINHIRRLILENKLDDSFKYLYGRTNMDIQKDRYIHAIDEFCECFGKTCDQDARIYSSPGRTEIGGNHTDHQHGCVLAGTADMDIVAVVSNRNDNIVRVRSVEYGENLVDISDLAIREEEKNKSNGVIRGILSRFSQLGYNIGGFDAFTTSNVIKASGLSSSAAFEVLIGTVLNNEFNNGRIDPVEIAQIGQYSENNYMGKPSGLLDQMSCSVGGFVSIDFNNPLNTVIKQVEYDFEISGYTICIVDTGGNHSDLTPEYGMIPEEMKNVAKYFGENVLRDVDENKFYENISDIRKSCGDRAILRSIHFFDENRRAIHQADSLIENDFDRFLKLVQESGESSYKYLQNVFSSGSVDEQGIPLALCISEKIIGTKGAYRVHGGGFAGVIQAFVPNDMVKKYEIEMEKIFGIGSCTKLRIRPVGGYELKI